MTVTCQKLKVFLHFLVNNAKVSRFLLSGEGNRGVPFQDDIISGKNLNLGLRVKNSGRDFALGSSFVY